MKCLYLCKASTKIGLGHLIRSKTLAEGFRSISPACVIDFIMIGDASLDKLLVGSNIKWTIVADESSIILKCHYDIVFFDMLSFDSQQVFDFIRQSASHLISLSPIFSHQCDMNAIISRTKYLDAEFSNLYFNNKLAIHKGLDFAIIQKNCHKIHAGVYEDNLHSTSFSIGISMGGGDAANHTLLFLRSLKKCAVPVTFWVMLGEGYTHSYDQLIREIKSDTVHEIILANANISMWNVLKNCVLLILPGGITSYEAVFAGLPSIIFLDDERQYFLIREIIENDAAIYGGTMNESGFLKLNQTIESLFHERGKLLEMHARCKNLISHKGVERIFDLCNEMVGQ